ncbi:hypothetical protein FRB90_005099 [Tulasnella sp. 427]|nr:hypothetical protein FRB90_005099 [Tulasnella sp. 427]
MHHPTNDESATSSVIQRAAQIPFLLVHRLPVEILAYIIQLSLDMPNTTFREQDFMAISNPGLFRALVRVGSVCRRWKDVVDGTPRLWAFLSADLDSPPLLRLVAERSQSTPILITTGVAEMDMTEFFNIAAPHFHRCRVLCVMPPDWPMDREESRDVEGIRNLLRQPCPALEELHLIELDASSLVDEHGTSMIEVWALENSTANLRVLRVIGTDWCWKPVLSGLQELNLGRVSITLANLMDSCLSLAPNLRILRLDHLRLIERGDPAHLSSAPVSLDFLHRITISSTPAEDITKVTQRINTPSLREVKLQMTPTTDRIPLAFIAPFLHYYDLIYSIVSTTPEPIQVLLEHRAQGITMFSPDHSSKVNIEEWQLKPQRSRTVPYAEWLANTWKSLPSTASISLTLRSIELARELLVPVMGIENITLLHLDSGVTKAQHLYLRLSYPVLSEGGTKRWLLPRLATIEIKESLEFAMLDPLVRMLRARYHASQDPGAMTSRSPGQKIDPPAAVKLSMVQETRSTYDFATIELILKTEGPKALAKLLCRQSALTP